MSNARMIALIVFLSFPAVAGASHSSGQASIDVQVIRAEPIYDRVNVNRPIEKCHWEQVPRYARGRPSETVNLLGAIAGGALGRHLGHGGQEEWLGTIVGGMLGHTLTREIQENRRARARSYPTRVQVCHMEDRWESRHELIGYEVTYELAGREFTSFSQTHPGATMRVELIPSG